jgi:tetraacyldisaccharide 4'-kinase
MSSAVESVLTRAWRRRGLLAWLLLPVSLLFRVLVAVRRRLYQAGWLRSTRLPVPVIVVGNVFVGGTGKTPFTIWLIDQLRTAGFTPGVISRGYGARTESPVEVTTGTTPAQVGDEPTLIALRTSCPLMVGRNRVAAAQALLATHPSIDVIVSDDGLQHYALQRDIEIVLCDERGDGNGWMLPAGPLREPASRSRDFTVVNAPYLLPRVIEPAFRMQLSGDYAVRLSDPSHAVPLSSVRAPRILAAAGIGNPERFFSMLKRAGLAIQTLPLPDHYDYADNPFAKSPADIILITEKDAVKCTQIDTIKSDPRLWVVPVAARVDGALAKRIVEKCRGRPTA